MEFLSDIALFFLGAMSGVGGFLVYESLKSDAYARHAKKPNGDQE